MNKISESKNEVNVTIEENELEEVLTALDVAAAAKRKAADRLFDKGSISLAKENEKEADTYEALKRKLSTFIWLPF